jgi:hydrogenase expression/formation protein HypC
MIIVVIVITGGCAMCLAVPAKVLSVDGSSAEAEIMGNRITVDISLLESVAIGDYVMVHAGVAIHKYDKQEALENLEMIKALVVNTESTQALRHKGTK